jgi:cysteinyl-tRNA synthetase
LAGCGSSRGPGRGFPEVAPWALYYGTAADAGDLAKLASSYRILVIDADPVLAGNWTTDQVRALHANGNRVLTYLDVGSCESYRSWWADAPPGHLSCRDNTKAQLGPYPGYPDEVYMNLADPDYQSLLVEVAAPKLAALPVDGFLLDNFGLVEDRSRCDLACAQGGLDLVAKLRARFPDELLVINSFVNDFTVTGRTQGVDFGTLLDGVLGEGFYFPDYFPAQESQLAAWTAKHYAPGGREFFTGTIDYVTSCDDVADAGPVYARSRAAGFSPYVWLEGSASDAVCYWPF